MTSDDSFVRNEEVEPQTTFYTNRFKAILAINLAAITTVAFISVTKIACNEKGLNSLDIIVFANIDSLVLTVIYSISVKESFSVEKKHRCALFTRSVTGLVGLMTITLGAALIPVSV